MVVGRHISSAFFVALLMAIGSGCSKSETSKTVLPAGGTVTMDGQPLAGANLTFIPADGTAGQGGTGSTDAAGKYEMTHFRSGKGVEPGAYRVVISKLVMQDGSPIPPGTHSAAELATKDAVPSRYSDYNNTTLTATVDAAGKPIDFALKSR